MSIYDPNLTYNPTGIAPGASWDSAWIDLQGYTSFHFLGYSNVASQIIIHFSMDKVNVDYTAGFSVGAGVPQRGTYIPQARYVFLRFTNNDAGNGFLRLQISLNSRALSASALKQLGAGTQILNESQLGIRSLRSSDASVSISNTADEIDVTVSSAGAVTSLSHTVPPFSNSYSILKTATPATGDVVLNWLTDDNTTDGGVVWTEDVSGYLTAKANITGLSLSSAGGTQSLVTDGTAPTFAIKGLTAGTNVTLTPTANDITISAGGGSNWTVSGAGASGYVYPSAVRGIVGGTSNTILTPTDIGILGSNGSTVKGSQSVIVGCSFCYQLTGDIISQCGMFCSSSCYQNVPTGGAQFRRCVTMACSESSYTPGTVSVFDSAIIGCYKGYINQGSSGGVLFSNNSTITTSGIANVIMSSNGGVGSNSSITGASSRCTIIGGNSSTITGCTETVVIGPSVTCTGNKSFTCNLGSTAWATSTANKWNVKAPGGAVYYSDDAATVGVSLSSGGNSWASVCDRNRKENIEVLNYSDILNRVDKLNVYKFNYIGNNPSQKCYSTMAQEWHTEETFKCDEYEVETEEIDEEGNPVKVMKCGKACNVIETQDQIGVLMACVKGLINENKLLKIRLENMEEVLREKGIM